MSDIIIRAPEPGDHEAKGSTLLAQALEFKIETHDDYEMAAQVKGNISATIGLIKREFDGTDDDPGPVKLAHAAWKSMVGLRDTALAKFEEAEAIWRRKISKYQFDIEEARRKEAEKARLAAEKKAAEERAKEIAAAKKAGDKEAARELKQAPLIVPAVQAKTPEIPTVAGARKMGPDWQFQIVNVSKLPREYLMPNERAIRDTVKRLGPQAVVSIPGISVYDGRSREV